MLLLILGLIMFVGLVVIHEMGHFFAARRNGVDVEEFGIGFPPKIWGKQITPKDKSKSPWLFTINLLPLGGFVRLKGENDEASDEGTFGAASLRAKTEIMAAGVLMNLITAYVLLTILALIGMPQIIKDQFSVASDVTSSPAKVGIADVEKGSPAAEAGLKEDDFITAIGPKGKEQQLKLPAELPDVTERFAGQEVVVQYERNGQQQAAVVELRPAPEVIASRKTDNPKGFLGVTPYLAAIGLERSTWSAPIVAAGLIKQFTVLTFQGLGKALAGVGSIIAGAVTGNTEARQAGQTQASSQVSGPLGIFVILKDGGKLGFLFILLIIAIISLTLAIMNFLPIPALDGGRLWLTLFFHGIGKPLSKEKEELINGIGFLVLMGLIILITFVDYKRFF